MSNKVKAHFARLRNYYENYKPSFRDKDNSGIKGIERYLELMELAAQILSPEKKAQIQEENLKHHIALQKQWQYIAKKVAFSK